MSAIIAALAERLNVPPGSIYESVLRDARTALLSLQEERDAAALEYRHQSRCAQEWHDRFREAEALLRETDRVLEWMHAQGGLGYEVHGEIEALLARIRASSETKQGAAPK